MIVFGENERCGTWADERIGYVNGWQPGFQTIGLEVEGELRAVVVYENFTGHDISMSLAVERASPSFLDAAFRYPFQQLKCRRVSSEIASSNEKALELVRKLGFELEGVKRDAIPDDDLLIYGMTRSECNYL